MEEFINHIKEQREIEDSNYSDGEQVIKSAFFLQLIEFKNEFDKKRLIIEELMMEGDFYITKCQIASLGNELAKLYEVVEDIEMNDDEDCGCNDKEKK